MPERSFAIDLKREDVLESGEGHDFYGLVLRYLQDLWRERVELVPDTAPPNMGEPFTRGSVRAYSTATFNGLQYGSDYKPGGFPYRHGYIEGRDAVRIAVILHIKHTRQDARLPPLEHTCAIVRRFVQDPEKPVMPWDLQ